MHTVVLGSQWGDEGKGKIIDILSKESDIIVRAQGGNNAGHTVVIDDVKYKFHLLPSGILYKDKLCILGNGMVIDPYVLLSELTSLNQEHKNIKISNRANIILFYHKLLDLFKEHKRGKKKIGTTCRGIGPCYADKINRVGIRMVDFTNTKRLQELLSKNLDEKLDILLNVYKVSRKKLISVMKQDAYKKFFDAKTIFSKEKTFQEYELVAKKIAPMITDTTQLISRAVRKKKKILFEGAQGLLLDIDSGTFPYVTSSNAGIGGIFTGSGAFAPLKRRIGITKAYTTRVGGGPFPTEENGREGKWLRERGQEFGTTTGRPRRCGWLDAFLLRYSTAVNGYTEIALTKLDVLSGIGNLKICTGYELDGKEIESIPADAEIFDMCSPIYKELPGWLEDITTCKRYDDLPKNAKRYITEIEKIIGVRIIMISVGPNRKQIIIRKKR